MRKHWMLTLGVLAVALAGRAEAADWYVRAGAKGGDGSLERPFKGIYKALGKAVKGDVVHVAGGDYSGKLGAGFIVVETPGLTLLGGYDEAFTTRDPFAHPTRIFKDETSKAQGLDVGLVKLEGDYRGLVIDGFVLDSTGRNAYDEKGDLQVTLSAKKPPITLSQPDCHLRNCIVLNAAHTAVIVRGAGSSVENCLILNAVYSGIHALGDSGAEATSSPILLRNNTVLFTWKKGATGGYGIDLGTGCQVTMQGNLLGYNEGYAVSNQLNHESESVHVLERCAMFQNKLGNYVFYAAENGTTLVVDDPEDFEDSDLALAEGNVLVDPFFKLDPEWFEKFSNQTAAEEPGKLEMDDMNELRRMLGLPLYGGKVEGRVGYGMAYPLAHVLTGALWTTEKAELAGIGVNPAGPFPIVTSGSSADAPELEYEDVTFGDVLGSGEAFVGKPVRFAAWYVQDAMQFKDGSGNAYLSGCTPETHVSIELRAVPRMASGMDTILGFVESGSAADMYFQRKVVPKRGSRDEVSTSFVVEGVLHKPGGFIREGALVLEIHAIRAK